MLSPFLIIATARSLGYEVMLLEDKPYLRYDFYSTTMDEAQDNYYDIVESLAEVGLEFEEPYIEHDCITGNIQEKIGDAMNAKLDELSLL